MKNSHQKIFFFLCLYKMVNISVETWNKAEVSVINIHENDNANKMFLKLIFMSDIAKRWGGKNFYDFIDKETKGNYRFMSDLKKQQSYKTAN